MVAGAEQTVNRCVQRVGSVARKDDSRGVRLADQVRELFASFLDKPFDFDRFPIRASPGGSAVAAHVLFDRVIDRLRLRPRSRCVIQIDAVG